MNLDTPSHPCYIEITPRMGLRTKTPSVRELQERPPASVTPVLLHPSFAPGHSLLWLQVCAFAEQLKGGK